MGLLNFELFFANPSLLVLRGIFSLKINKSPKCDEISFNVIKNCFSELNMQLKYLFDMSLVFRKWDFSR